MVRLARAKVMALSEEAELGTFLHVVVFGHCDCVFPKCWHQCVSICRTGDT